MDQVDWMWWNWRGIRLSFLNIKVEENVKIEENVEKKMFDLIPHFPKGCTVPEPKAQMCWLNFLGWNFPTRKDNFWATKYYHCFHALIFHFATETHPADLVWSLTLFRLDQMCMVGKGFQRSLWSKNRYPPCKNQKEIEMKMIFKNPVFSWTLNRRKFGNIKIQNANLQIEKRCITTGNVKGAKGKFPIFYYQTQYHLVQTQYHIVQTDSFEVITR